MPGTMALSSESQHLGINDSLVARLADAMQRDFPEVKPSVDPAWYRTDALKVIDCVLSLNRNYDRFVVPRLDKFEQKHKGTLSVSHLQALMRSYGSPHEFMQQCLNYNHAARADVLMAVVDYLATVGDLLGWARTADVTGVQQLHIRGFGIAGWQYLRMLFGADTVKPDIYIKRYVEQVIGKPIGVPVKLVRLFEDASRSAGLSAIEVDNAIWEENARAAKSVIGCHQPTFGKAS